MAPDVVRGMALADCLQLDRHTGRRLSKQTNKQTNKQTGRQANISYEGNPFSDCALLGAALPAYS